VGAANELMGKRKGAAALLSGRVGNKSLKSKQQHVQQLNDELVADVIAASGRSDLVMLGIETIGVKQMTTLFSSRLTGAIFSATGFTKKRLKELGHDPASPVDTAKPTVIVSAKNMVSRGLAGSRSDVAHEFIHGGIAALANFKPHNIGPNLEESIARHHDMVTGNQREKEVVKKLFRKKGWSHETAKYYYDQLNKKAKSRRRKNIGLGGIMNE
jgi:hypothetical protein